MNGLLSVVLPAKTLALTSICYIHLFSFYRPFVKCTNKLESTVNHGLPAHTIKATQKYVTFPISAESQVSYHSTNRMGHNCIRAV